MSGPPVVIAENGLGLPVKPVEEGAPVLTVAENGLGAPIVISDNGAPFVVEGLGPPSPARTPFINTTRSMHSGHSLTDAYYGSPQGNNDGYMTEIRDSLLSPATGGSGTYMFKNTFGGSSMEDRWDGNSLARTDIGNYDALMITEAGPPPHLGLTVQRTFSDINTRWDYWLKFAANTVENGAAPEVILWSIWPPTNIASGEWSDDWEGVSYGDALDEYGQIYETMAAYGTAKMKALYPALPADWRVWLIPGHRFWKRIVADLATSSVPTISTLGDLFSDTIHPDSRAQYGLACLAYTCLYQVDLRTQTGVFVPGGFDPDLRDYFWQIAWEIATAYEPIGMGGTEAEGSLWVEGVDADFMPDWTLSVSDTSPGWAEIVPSGLTNSVWPAISGGLVEGTLQTMTAGTWSVTPDEVQYVWRYDWSDIASETNTCTPEYDSAGQQLSGWVRARLVGGPWTGWQDASGEGVIGRARWCKLTTGTFNAGGGNVLTGYGNGTGFTAFGSKDREPIAGQTFLSIFHNALNNQVAIAFAGDIVAQLAGMSAYLDAREFKGTWTYSASGNPFGTPVTWLVLTGQAAIAQPQVYDFRIAPASP